MLVSEFLCPHCARESVLKDDEEKMDGSWFRKEEIAEHTFAAHGHRLRDPEILLREWSGIGMYTERQVEDTRPKKT
jgi:hypothetical protein